MQRYLVTVALLGLAGAVQADPVIYDNNVTPTLITPSQDRGAVGHVQSADDFVLPGGGPDWRVTDVHWGGGEFLGGEGGDFGFGITSFRIIFYADDGGIPTGNGMADPTSTAIAVRDVTASLSPFAGGTGAEYWADIDPVILSGGTPYWIAIQAVSDTEDIWGWFTDLNSADPAAGIGNSVVGSSEAVIPYWSDPTGVFGFPAGTQYELFFSLTGTQVPAPGAALLAMLGLPAIGWVKRRFS